MEEFSNQGSMLWKLQLEARQGSHQQAKQIRTWLRDQHKKKCKLRVGGQELPLWHNGIGSILGALGCGSIPSPAQCIRNLASQHLWLSSRLQLSSDPWPKSSMCLRAAKNEGEKNKKVGRTNSGSFFPKRVEYLLP